ncbi:hypothetical protein [Robiginitalea sp. SC105]|uniref:hypothetical protein n=1 Tax=Robiginitalea sp. SC105 TaxID=2762332 RepID=UPI00163A7FD1|nr:hypothetical protein [Robiginitalea sp. SC105]MBC2840091.1 hypothetical protein [Robiginitalea sp. SC105]
MKILRSSIVLRNLFSALLCFCLSSLLSCSKSDAGFTEVVGTWKSVNNPNGNFTRYYYQNGRYRFEIDGTSQFDEGTYQRINTINATTFTIEEFSDLGGYAIYDLSIVGDTLTLLGLDYKWVRQ